MVNRANRSRIILDILIIAWILSVIPLLLVFMYSAPGFPDVAPSSSLGIYLCAGLFAGLQIAVAIANARQRNSTLALIVAICIAVLLLYPEMLIFFFLLILWPFVICVAAIAGSVRMLRLVLRLRRKQPKA